jgi:hypothetical protein
MGKVRAAGGCASQITSEGQATDSPDRRFAEAVPRAGGSTASKLGLTFDRVALRVVDRLRAFVDAHAPEGMTVVLAVTAPVRVPARTAADLGGGEVAALLQTGGTGSNRSFILHGNRVELRLVEQTFLGRDRKLLGFVHNSDVPAAQVLDVAELLLRSSTPEASPASD